MSAADRRDDKILIAVNGAAGKMGRRILAQIFENPKYVLAAAFERQGHPELGKDAGFLAGARKCGVTLKSLEAADRNVGVIIDFSSPEGSTACLAYAKSARKPAVICTTGLAADHEKSMMTASKKIPIVYAPNMSLGLNVILHFAEAAARWLGPDYDVEIVEVHHRQKKDAPSGSARALADAVRRGRGDKLADVHGRQGVPGARDPQELGVLSVRGGDVVGDHTVHFLGAGERVELTHRATTRDTFALGALRAAEWVISAPPGLYGMHDVLGLPSA